MKVAILGASDKVDRYSYKALKMLEEYGHEVYLVHPNLKNIEGRQVYSSLDLLTKEEIDTLTLYVNPAISSAQTELIKKLKPRRVLFNPGSENLALFDELKSSGIEVVEGCTLVMLRSKQF